MRQWLDRYYGSLRKVKLNYVLLNLANARRLRHTQAMLRRHGIKRSALLPLGSAQMPKEPGDIPWLDRPGAIEALAADPRVQALPPALREAVMAWPEKGYLILRGCFSTEEVAAINAEVDRLIDRKEVDFNFTGRKIMFAFRHSDLLRNVVSDRRILDVLDLLLGRRMRPFQSINFLTGSEQAAHSDSIHMTTYPRGYLTAAWVALEPMSTDNGTLVYYPGSHKLPYMLYDRYDHGGTRYTIGDEAYARYEEAVAKAIREHDLRPQEFIARPGDVLIWHANLLHGGKPMATPNASRKSMAVHYFAEDVVCYHELTQRAAWIDPDDGLRS